MAETKNDGRWSVAATRAKATTCCGSLAIATDHSPPFFALAASLALAVASPLLTVATSLPRHGRLATPPSHRYIL